MIIMPERLQELMDELKAANAESFYHSLHVKAHALAIMKKMSRDGVISYTKSETKAILKGALLHDIGKLFVKNVVLTKDTKLTSEEKKHMTEHTHLGFEAVESSLTDEEYDIVKNICLYHHERIDGKGYEGKTDLPMYVQIISACDVYDALTTDRTYRKALSHERALSMIQNGDCGTFAPEIVKYLKEIEE